MRSIAVVALYRLFVREEPVLSCGCMNWPEVRVNICTKCLHEACDACYAKHMKKHRFGYI